MQPEDIPRAAPPVVAIYGQESENEVLADELALDGYDVRLVSDPAMLGEVDLIVFGRTSPRGASLGALRALRQGQLAGSGARALWMSTTSDATDTLRAFEAGADDVIRAPFVYAELLGFRSSTGVEATSITAKQHGRSRRRRPPAGAPFWTRTHPNIPANSTEPTGAPRGSRRWCFEWLRGVVLRERAACPTPPARGAAAPRSHRRLQPAPLARPARAVALWRWRAWRRRPVGGRARPARGSGASSSP
jgi:CheY-like chemotaxis protein